MIIERIFREYEELGHMSEVSEIKKHYMWHKGVYHPQKITTKMRTVFIASSVTISKILFNSFVALYALFMLN